MPFYVYECKKCGNKEDVSHAMDSKKEVKCKCGETMVKLLSSNYTFKFLGKMAK